MMVTRRRFALKKNSSSTAKTYNVTLVMECENAPLSEVQLSMKKKAEDEYKQYSQFMEKFNESVAKHNGKVTEQNSFFTTYEIDCTPNFSVPIVSKDIGSSGTSILKSASGSTLLSTSQTNVQSLISNNSVLLPSGTVASSGSTVFSGQPTYQLVVGPRMGLLVTPSTAASATTIPSSGTNNSTTNSIPVVKPSAPRVQVRPGLGGISQPAKRFSSPAAGAGKIIINPATQKTSTPLSSQKTPTSTKNNSSPATAKNSIVLKNATTSTATSKSTPPSTSSVNTRSKGKMMTRSSNASESASSTSAPPKTYTAKSSSNAVVDLTDDDSKSAADTREMTINRYPGRIYPSLVVVARPYLKAKEMSSSVITAERTQLDTKVKGILTNSPTKFTEWLIQQGLVRSEQGCNIHVNVDLTPIKLKLGMYSDATKFPHSGGYVWISDCCPQKFVSVFCNSIFEGASHAPTILLKLMYHWSCQTNVHNIISWVKVDNLYIKNFFTNLRAVCTAAVCEKFGKMGGANKKVEVGVISLGTTSQNGSIRQVKVEVLGVMDPVTKYVRLRAVDPVQNAEKNHKLRFTRILESLEPWVHKNTTIITDFTIDKTTLNELGFAHVVQVQLNSAQGKESNQAIMDYLKRVVPRMFQNTLSLLSRSIIQQFLDELVWRERWGPISSRAFDNLVLHLSEMTKLETGDTLVNRLKCITANPFRDWSFKNWKVPSQPSQANRKQLAENVDGDNANKSSTNKTITTRSKPSSVSTISGKQIAGTVKTVKLSSPVTMKTDDSSGEPGQSTFSVDNSPSNYKEVDDDTNSVSSSSSRRGRNRGSSAEDVALKPLESYYYGVLPPDAIVVNKLKKVELNMKCFVCGLTYNNNIQFMKHLAGHAQDEGAFTTDYQCRYCFKNLTSAYDLEDHLGSTHLPNKYNSMCLICSERFKTRATLVSHMHSVHSELELPYNCTICKFRCSEHTKAVDHFYEVHDSGEKVQCPFCLKVVAFESSTKTKLTQNVNFFFNHLKRHQQKRKCPKCVLSYVNKSYLKEHLTKDHHSCIAIPGVIRYQTSELSVTLMPLPPTTSLNSRKGRLPTAIIPKFSAHSFDGSFYFPDTPAGKCLECKTTDTVGSHFSSYLQCMKCMFASCCKERMYLHMATMHEMKRNRRYPPKKTIPLAKPLYCVCGFSSSCGNSMASHLVHCKRRIAYPSAERAAQYSVQMQSASFPALVNLDDAVQDQDDASDKWLRAFVKNSDISQTEEKTKRPTISEKSPPRMLKELGLVRKESTSNESEGVTVKTSVASGGEPTPSANVDDKHVKFTNSSNKRRSSDGGDGTEIVSSENEDAEDAADKPKVKRKKLKLLTVVDTAFESPDKDSAEEDPSTVDETERDVKVPATQLEKNIVDELYESKISSSPTSVDSGKLSNKSTQPIKQIDEVAIRSENNTEEPQNERTVDDKNTSSAVDTKDDTFVNERVRTISVSDESAEAVSKGERISKFSDNIEAISKIEDNVEVVSETSQNTETVTKIGGSKEIFSEISEKAETIPKLDEKVETISKIGEESADMETEEPSPVTEKMDDAEEVTVAMECEDNIEESSMSFDTDPSQDAMIID